MYPITHIGSFDSQEPDQRTLVERMPGGWAYEHSEEPRPADYDVDMGSLHGDMSGFWEDVKTPSLLDVLTGSVFTSAAAKNITQVAPAVVSAGTALAVPGLSAPAYRVSELMLAGGSPQVLTVGMPKNGSVASQTGAGMLGKTGAVPVTDTTPGIVGAVVNSATQGTPTSYAVWAAGLLGTALLARRAIKKHKKGQAAVIGLVGVAATAVLSTKV